jgi:hypothetical protein
MEYLNGPQMLHYAVYASYLVKVERCPISNKDPSVQIPLSFLSPYISVIIIIDQAETMHVLKCAHRKSISGLKCAKQADVHRQGNQSLALISG